MTPPPPPDGWIRVPIGNGAARWRTVSCERTVLVVVRTFTTVAWLLDLLPALIGDRRVQVLFTLNGNGSAYEAGVIEQVSALGGRSLPWEQAVAEKFDLAISASHYGGLQELRSPLLILPHGAGYGKTISHPQDGFGPLPDVEEALRSTITIAHPSSAGHWRNDPSHGQQVVVTGDHCYDRLRASRAERVRYRAALAVGDRRLVVLSSTWGPESLIGRDPGLPDKLLAELPVDEYTVAAALHSNVWRGHGSWQVRVWLGRALESGLRLIPYHDGWRAALIAADCLIGDHGSATLYGACVGVPTLLGAFGEQELLADSAASELGKVAPRLASERGLREQIETAIREHEATYYEKLADRSFAYPGEGLPRLRRLVYELLQLEEPAQAVQMEPVPAPTYAGHEATVLRVASRVSGSAAEPLHVALERFPAAVEQDEASMTDKARGEHLCVLAAERYQAVRESAGVIVGSDQDMDASGAEWPVATLATYPVCRVAITRAGEGGSIAAVRDRGIVRVQDAAGDPALAGSALAALASHGALNGPDRIEFTLRVGDEQYPMTATLSSDRQAGP